MNFFKKIFGQKPLEKTVETQRKMILPNDVSLDEAFVQNFITKGGKFLYCANQEEVNYNLQNVIKENHWEKATCFDNDLSKLLTIVETDSTNKVNSDCPFFTLCEHLLAEDGSIMFSSTQVHEYKISDLSPHFIVFAKTSQLVRNKSEGLMGIRKTYVKTYPTNISSIKSYVPERVEEDFLNYGNDNAKNLYLLLLEDL